MNDDLKALRAALEPSRVFWVLAEQVGEEEALMKLYRAFCVRQRSISDITGTIQRHLHNVSLWFGWSDTLEGRDFWINLHLEVGRTGDEVIGGRGLPV